MDILSVLMSMWHFIYDFFVVWIGFFLAPLKNFEMLWVIIPVYLSWLFTEIFQEKKSTSLGNAISNGTVTLWAGIDGLRYTVRSLLEKGTALNVIAYIKLLIAFCVLVYGLVIIVEGIRAKKITHYIGRMRNVTYILLIAIPVFYNVIAITWKNFIIFVIGFPIFYGIVELIDRITPTPKIYKEDEGIGKGENEPSEQQSFYPNEDIGGSGSEDRYMGNFNRQRIRRF